MIEQRVAVKNPKGLHMRPAMIIVQAASRFRAIVELELNEQSINAKSLLSILTLGAAAGTILTVRVSGEDENEALKEVASAIQWQEEECGS